ncbi:hypothetical protein M9H77_18234 [Catharanthus roseus]|uniref:Uncharacterized protein n=1 Tax=Catharanthus roseus TaxID=4058 RepID=A0ACC0B6X0_CATRO|nr:hypothetical protein M9H77_18234 [Catharanthus roseus]
MAASTADTTVDALNDYFNGCSMKQFQLESVACQNFASAEEAHKKISSSSGYTSLFSGGETHPKTSRKNPFAKITETTREKPRPYLRHRVCSSSDEKETRTRDGAEYRRATEAVSRGRRL